jgi:hypothetical protein
MAENKKSFLMYADFKSTFEALSDKEAGKLIKHLMRYVNDENPTCEDKIVKVAFEPIKQQLKRDLKKYEQVKGKRSEAGKASAEQRKQKATNSTSVQSAEQKPTNSTVTGNGTVNVTVTEIEKTRAEITIKPNQRDIFFKDIENSQYLELTARDNGTDLKTVKAYIPTFRTKANPVYTEYDDFVRHFRSSFALHHKKNSQNQKPAKELG